jgi:AcrR family transcriptional regulator
MTGRKPARPRNRDTTASAILDAAAALLAREGFPAFGVNAVAREAGCDKQLIYRYFDGADGLLDALGERLADWVAVRMRPLEALGRPRSYSELMLRMALGFLHALRDDPLVRRLVAWEVAAPTPQVRRLADARGRALAAWMHTQRGGLTAPADCDAPAITALLIGAIQHLVVAAVASGGFAGMRLVDEADWERVRTALRVVIEGAFGGAR